MSLDNHLIQAPIPQLIKQLSIPAGVGLLFNTLFNVVDNYFAGWISTESLAALSLGFPVFFMIIAVGGGVSNGVNALISTALGANNKQRASITAVQSISFYGFLSVLLTLLYFLIRTDVFRFLGAKGDILADCLAYMDIIFIGSFLFLFSFLFNSMLSAQGDTKPFRNFLVTGFFLNLLLDPLFVKGFLFIPAMGLQGIALATIIIETGGMIYLAIKVIQSKLILDFSFSDFIPLKKEFKIIAAQGIPASMNLVTIGLGVFVITYFIALFGDTVLAAYGVALRIEQIVLLPILGLNVATLTLVAQNHGAGKFDRLQETIRRSLLYGGIISLFGSGLIYLMASQVVSFFTQDIRVIEEGALYLKIAAFILQAYVILFIGSATLQGLKKPIYTFWLGVFRQLLAPVFVFYLAVEIYLFGVNAIWWGIFGITWSAALITWLLVHKIVSSIQETTI